MLACLLINNCDDYLIEITELLAFYSYKWELGDSGEVYIDFDSIGDRIRVLIYELELKHQEIRSSHRCCSDSARQFRRRSRRHGRSACFSYHRRNFRSS